ncbi:uncharacterized protein HMPREF1541_10831 [Cyphellophora europaea CBS 101466]|uniref:Bifunctional cytochrome P450/NADPH--P450 reductase n=1 Tax=Cyphellophora europaea (strain CBS 101466) TaxID=1220924 RepID=W2S5I7_CYPE1|nr:uncharacterized protein HMPREF1541_10831 [Cyphellophora europaea CBS 101466]ETN43966.1 hypothetical protein HMPREF1541_10831 [Cyphellophora europaea CBS 101466]
MSIPIPQPPGLPILGNVRDIDPNNASLSLIHLAEKYGPIFKLNIVGQDRYFVASAELLNEICDEKRFHKAVSGPLKEVRNGVGDGLFTAYHGEHNWEVAHRTLVPAFGPIGIHDMYDEMYDIATQLVAKWARLGEEDVINVTDDYTRLTLDSIALCAMDKRFNSFYHEAMHPFVNAMVGFLVESGLRPRRTRLEQLWNGKATRQYQENIELMRSVAQEVIDRRRANPSSKKDLLNAMLFGKDPKTGERLTDESIMNNMNTFLIAGHETTSGLLSYASYYLCKYPEAMRKAQAEVDSVIGKGPVKFEHMNKLPYLEAVLRETLRLQPTAPAFTVTPQETMSGPVVLAGKYYIPSGAPIIAALPAVARDPVAFGADADEFRPERMYGENFAKLPPNAWKPFGNGARGCIGRPFAWQEGLLALSLILQNFNLRMADPSYQLRSKQTLTIKPDGFFMRANLRSGIDPIKLEKKMYAGLEEQSTKSKPAVSSSAGPKKPMTILYGSNSGTCEGLSQTLAGNATAHGFEATIKSMDAAVDRISVNEPLIVITASYEGNPPDNANSFVEWLKNQSVDLKNLRYAVFGCGHHDWVSTYQKIPTLVDTELEARGASRLAPRGESDVAAGTVFDDFDHWQDDALWPQLGGAGLDAVPEGIDLEISTVARASHLNYNVQEALVVSNEVLTAPGTPEKRHIQLKLPTSLTYEAGDYLALLPINSLATVSRVLRRFGLPWDSVMTLGKGSHTTIPTEKELSIGAVLSSYVELNASATKKHLSVVASFATDEATKEQIMAQASDTASTPSVLDVLEAHTEIRFPFRLFLSMLFPMRIRQYSISSSPLQDPTIATITFSMADKDANHLGVATNYLKRLQPGSTTQVMVKKSQASFHLPLDEKTPVIMFGAGSGLAPFRGFVQERVARLQANPEAKLGEAVLFVGCRDPTMDKLFADELEAAERLSAVKVFYAFSRAADKSEGCKYVQDRLWHERAEASRLFDEGARVYICGSSAVGKGIASTAARIAVEAAAKRGKEITFENALQWWEGLRGERYAVDVFD